jgi:hypothetical protein
MVLAPMSFQVGPAPMSVPMSDQMQELIEGFIKFLDEEKKGVSSSKTEESLIKTEESSSKTEESSNKTEEDKDLKDKLLKSLLNMKKEELEQLSLVLDEIKSQNNKGQGKKDAENKDENKVTTKERLLRSFKKFLEYLKETPGTVPKPMGATPLTQKKASQRVRGG